MRHLAPVFLLLLPFGLLTPSGAAPAQRVASSAAEQEEAVADAALRSARREQARFERVRRNHLPWAWGGGGGECDERIGRFCLTHGNADEDWRPPPEEPAVILARGELLDRLDEAAGAAPTDGWVAGQRVRYLLEAGRSEDAVDAALECRTPGWWCPALQGFAAHAAGDARAAEAAFESMLTAMPADERAAWTDPSIVLDACSRRERRRAGDTGRARFDARFWRLADPFASRAGNELRSEHLSRHVWDRLQDRARSTEGIRWGDDLREIVLRFGWPTGWERVRGRPGLPGPTPMVSHYPSPGRNLLPPCESLGLGGAGEWDRDQPRPRASFALPLGDSTIRWVDEIDHQLAFFRRGDSAVVVAAYRLPADSFPLGTRTAAALAIIAGAAIDPPLVTRLPSDRLTGRAAAAAPTGDILVSLEVVAEATGRAARVRHTEEMAAAGPDLFTLSDILLLHGSALPESLESAAAVARTSNLVEPGEQLAVFWEVYGVPLEREEELVFSLSLIESSPGWLTRLARRIGLVGSDPPVQVRWRERRDATGALPRALTIEIPADLRAGDYTVELKADLPGRDGLVARRAIRVEAAS